MRALYPCSLQIPHSLGRLAGGTLVSVEGVVEEEEVRVLEENEEGREDTVVVAVVAEDPVACELAGVERVVEDAEVVLASVVSGMEGLGQVVSLLSSGQNSQILL